MLLNRPTTSWRFAAQARTSGDHLPIVVTLHTPDGQVVIAHTVLTVHSTDISFVGSRSLSLPRPCCWSGGCARRRRAGPPAGALTVASPRRARTLALRTSAVYVAVGTGVSRLTGLLRFVALAWALGQTPLADAYNLANTTPNMLYDIVLGGILSATFIPVFVDRLATRTERERSAPSRPCSPCRSWSSAPRPVGTGVRRRPHRRADRARYAFRPRPVDRVLHERRWPPRSCAGS